MNTNKGKQESVEILFFKYDSKRIKLHIDIIMGEAFHLFNNKFFIDRTPYQDQNLIPIEDIEIKDNRYLVFNSLYKKKKYHIIDCIKYEGAIYVADFIMKINNDSEEIERTSDSFEIQFEDNNLKVRIENKKENKLIIIGYNQYRNYFTLRFPEPAKEYKLGKCTIDRGTIYIKCIGPNLWDEADKSEGFEYQWKLDLPSNITEVAEKLLEIGFENR